jgi:hypothetical protein
MEVPPSSSSFPNDPGPSTLEEPSVRKTDRDACRYLSEELAPYLRHARRPVLAKAVRGAVEKGTLTPLTKLPERQRRELLEVLEARLETTHRGPSPTVLVRLTSAIASPTEADLGLGRRVASPAR